MLQLSNSFFLNHKKTLFIFSHQSHEQTTKAKQLIVTGHYQKVSDSYSVISAAMQRIL